MTQHHSAAHIRNNQCSVVGTDGYVRYSKWIIFLGMNILEKSNSTVKKVILILKKIIQKYPISKSHMIGKISIFFTA